VDRALSIVGLAEAAVQAAWAAWRDHLALERRLSDHTLRAYENDVAQFFAFLAEHRAGAVSQAMLAGLSLSDFRAFLARQSRKGHANGTRARALAGVRSFLVFCDRRGVAKLGSFRALKRPKVKKGMPRPLAEDDALSLVETAEAIRDGWLGLRDRALFTLLYACGLRIDEALKLDGGDAPTPDGVRVTGKGSKTRIVPVVPAVLEAIAAYAEACPYPIIGDGPLFYGARGGRLAAGVAEKAMRDLRRALQLPENVTPHTLRHSFATHLLGSGVDMRAVQELLGHASLSTTQVYAELDSAALLATYTKTHPRATVK
jgi:integrase/recombinase XerC